MRVCNVETGLSLNALFDRPKQTKNKSVLQLIRQGHFNLEKLDLSIKAFTIGLTVCAIVSHS